MNGLCYMWMGLIFGWALMLVGSAEFWVGSAVLWVGHMFRVGQNHTYLRFIYGILAGKPPNIRSYMVYIYDSGQPYIC